MRKLCILLVALSSSSYALPAAAEWRLHASAGAGTAISGYQKDEFGWGPYGSGAVEYAIIPELGVQFEVSGLWLARGEASPLGYRSDSTWTSNFLLGARARPFYGLWNGKAVLHPAGLWASGAAGVVFTGDQVRAGLDAALGWDLLFAHGGFGIGPMAGWLHVFQENQAVRPEDANVLFFGLHALLDFGPRIDKDRDNDGKLNEADACPNDPEDKDGFEDEDGCPDPDNDGDGIRDAEDRCPLEPEDVDEFEDTDGCPDPDNDKDNISDLEDLCPNEPEVLNGYADHDGCPDEEQVRVVGEKIVLDEQVLFQTDKADLLPESHPMLDRVAKLLQANPQYVHVRVDGHTDERGSDELNQRLSEERAQSVVDYLISKGIQKERLSIKGFGATQPKIHRSDPLAYTLNRRVEFQVTRNKIVKTGDTSSTSDTSSTKDAPTTEGDPSTSDVSSTSDAPSTEDAPSTKDTSSKEEKESEK